MGNSCRKKSVKVRKQNSIESFSDRNIENANSRRTKNEGQIATTTTTTTTTNKTKPPVHPQDQLKKVKTKKAVISVQNESILGLSKGTASNSLPVQSVIPNVRQSKNLQASDDEDKPKPDFRSFPITEFSSECKTDRMVLRMCPEYIGVNGCNEIYCYRFHVCSYWVNSTCRRANCSKDHHFQSKHNQNMFRFLQTESFGEGNLKNQLKRNFYRDKILWEDSPVICSRFILRQCSKSDCEDYHSKSLFCWEMCLNDKWTKFSNNINETIEKSFSDPSNSEIVINFRSNEINTFTDSLRLDLIFPGEFIKINFDLMQLLTPDNVSCSVRRVSTLPDMVLFMSVATRWLWYRKSLKGTWKFYSNAVVNKFSVIAFSDYIESQYLKKSKEFVFKFQPGGNDFKIDFENMTQVNTYTSASVEIQRRPVPFHQLNKRIVNGKKLNM